MQWLDQRTTARSARQDGGTTEAAVGSIGAAAPTGAASGFPELSMRSLTASRLPQIVNQLAERQAVDILHDIELHAMLFACAEHGDDMWMMQLCRGRGLVLKALELGS